MQSHPVTPSTLQLFSDRELQDHVRDGENCDAIEMQAKALAAQRWCEEYTNRDFLTTERVAYFDSFPHLFRLDRPPWQSVESVKYLDKAGDQQTLDSEIYRFTADRGRLFLRYGECWPSVLCESDSIEVAYTTGWETAEDVPADIKQAVLFMFGHNWEVREAVILGSINSVIQMTVESYLSSWVAPRY